MTPSGGRMFASRRVCFASLSLMLGLVGCDRQPLDPLEASSVGPNGLRAPSGTDAKPSTSSTIDITWTDNSPPNEAGFRIERSVAAGVTWTTARTVGPNATTVRDDGFQTAEQPGCQRFVANKHPGDPPP